MVVEFSDIQSALDRIKNIANHTPILSSRTLNKKLDAKIYFKCENFQRVGAFKFRGAYNTILLLTDKQKANGIITHSSGNHAQAVALASKLLGIKATIVMPNNSPKVKVNATQNTYSANVVFCENTIQSRQETCGKIMEENGQFLIHPYDNDYIIAGAGTAALELLNEIKDIDIILAPVGGGGLLSGTSIASKGFNPKIQVFGCEPKLADDAYRSFHSGNIETNKSPSTIADGLRTNLCERTLKIIRENVDEIILVSEQEIIDAMRFIWERMKIIIEPSSAVPLAGLLTGKISIKNKKVGIIISGGNVDLGEFFNFIQQGIQN